ncbi:MULTISPECIES: NAD(P)/FAD-dependent oxidoreductase [unclassified Mycobacterium]|uniref:flavin-containing monooxygenase n=1 Tax=unclassified Mycobacterium TaxID=2642494 RepID=UPI0029C8F5A7|nr:MULTISPECIES: NAD(P)/FAD-dependent oxidoreductase [unclassified Mycobacterium]
MGEPEYSDVLIIGAGISGLGAAYRIHERNPQLSYTILERRERIGGTWDLFRYPGIRSDSDIFTLSFSYEPWTRPENLADGQHIREYLTETARKNGIDSHIRFNTHVQSVDWDSTTDTWTVRATRDGVETLHRGRFLFFGTGYYNYDAPYTPEFPGLENFTGQVIHPQYWPESFDYADKKLVVIGSGATAISMIPSLTKTAAHVTMLQRSPTYLMSVAKINPALDVARKVLPRKVSHAIARAYFKFVTVGSYAFARKAPETFKKVARATALRHLPADYDVDTHFKPRYNPWDQRLCVILGGDFYEEIKQGRVEVVTDQIDHMDATGIVLKSGGHLEADVIVTATGLQLQALGGVAVSVDGAEIKPTERFAYKEYLLEDVPNMAWCIGYTNASWTLRADMTARAVAKLLEFMGSHGYTHAYPHLGDTPMPEKPTFDLQSGYVQRALHALPKSGVRRPWKVRHNYVLDVIDHRFDRIEESMVFGRVQAQAVKQPKESQTA